MVRTQWDNSLLSIHMVAPSNSSPAKIFIICSIIVISGLAGCLGKDEPHRDESEIGSPDTEHTQDHDEKEPEDSEPSGTKAVNTTADYRPRVIVGVPDVGLNPYHEMFYRPNLTEHPCTYLESFPCGVEKLALSVGGDDWKAAYEADRNILESVEEGKMYWIPETVFVAVTCQEPAHGEPLSRSCLTSGVHAAGTTSSIITENPDALIAFAAGNSWIQPFDEAGIPVDVYSISWGHSIPLPVPNPVSDLCLFHDTAPLYVKGTGNDPYSAKLDCWTGDPRNIIVGGGYPADQDMPEQERSDSAKNADVVSYYCRPGAKAESTSGMEEVCGTSFATPTVAGALSKVILGLRKASGYTGGIQGDYVDPVLEISVNDLRSAMNRTASYEPEGQFPSHAGIPVNPVAPWVQWGWGFYDGLVANATLAHLLGAQEAPEKPDEARLYMETIHTAQSLYYGES